MQGRIACCNTLSDIYAMGIDRVDHMLMILGVSREMTEYNREIVTREMIRGFNDCATEGGTAITGGQSIMNPWPIIGGVANVMCNENEYVRPNFGRPGDILVLTKPLGTQVVVNLKQWHDENNEKWKKALDILSAEEMWNGYHMAMESMAHLNRDTAKLMMKYGCHGATDITGFGLKGHAQNLVNVQQNEPLDFIIHSLPILDKMELIAEKTFKLLQGFSAETSGGIFCMISPDKVKDFVREHREQYGQEVWIVGEAIKAQDKTAPKAIKFIFYGQKGILQIILSLMSVCRLLGKTMK